ncbi:type II toxin-antitoxin system CcdA family antitoxin [Rhizosaccharibacter radicis]|uniref:Type II toxin-antitoxin system CcdA family antitoxin n=1 Tax=Rhizosaccharibacter radicis TaxID=2782605 RepID=A0ABT1VUW0_9PROT|nr:type II toxin-antitoxin system CcdA family antitoxin [Acetobacteraceae bacterium KSS12]
MPRAAKLSASPRRATNVTLPEPLLREARSLGVNLSQTCERGLAAAFAASRRQRWLDDNRTAIDSYNEHIAEHGLPLAAFRSF